MFKSHENAKNNNCLFLENLKDKNENRCYMAFNNDKLAKSQLVGKSDLVEVFLSFQDARKRLSNKHLEFLIPALNQSNVCFFLFFLISVLYINGAKRPVSKNNNGLSLFQTLLDPAPFSCQLLLLAFTSLSKVIS